MMKYLVILLSDKSLSYCHYNNAYLGNGLIPLDILKNGIIFGMKQNLMIQFVYPDEALPKEYEDVIESIDSVKYKSISVAEREDVGISDNWPDRPCDVQTKNLIVRRSIEELLMDDMSIVESSIRHFSRINIVITDIEAVKGIMEIKYKQWITGLSTALIALYNDGVKCQINVLTDRILLDSAKHCNAGVESITLAPDGKFYICPAFYYSEMENAGTLGKGVVIKNRQLLKLENAPICKICDAYHCKRCVWLNKKLTQEINTPSKQQCVSALIEREGSRLIVESLRTGNMNMNIEIPVLDYEDPFEKLISL